MPIFDDAHRDYLATLTYSPRVVLVLACCVEFIIFFDRGQAAGSIGQVRQDAKISGTPHEVLSETKAGLLTSLFIIGFGIFSPIFAGLGGKLRTRTILVVGMVLWIGSTILCALSPNYGALLTGRALSGSAEAAFTPYFLTLLDNVAPPAHRTVYIAAFWMQVAVGTAAGMAVGGIVSPHIVMGLSGWRFLFWIECAIGVILAVLLFMLPRGYEVYALDEKDEKEIDEADHRHHAGESDALRNGEQDEAEEDVPPAEPEHHIALLPALAELFKNGRYMCLCIAYGCYQYAVGALSAFIVLAVTQSRLDISQAKAAIITGVALLFSGIVGSVCFGVATDRYAPVGHPKCVQRATGITAVAALISLPLGIICLAAQTSWLFILTLIPSTFLLIGLTPAITVALLGVVRPPLRVYSISLQMLVCHGLGDSISPVIVGRMATTFAGRCNDAVMSDCVAMNFDNTTYFPSGGSSKNWFSGECTWIQSAHRGDDPYCANTMALQKALMVAYAISSLMVPLWGAVALQEWCCSSSSSSSDAAAEAADAEKKIQQSEAAPLLDSSPSSPLSNASDMSMTTQ